VRSNDARVLKKENEDGCNKIYDCPGGIRVIEDIKGSNPRHGIPTKNLYITIILMT
jgi:hypothetical protein